MTLQIAIAYVHLLTLGIGFYSIWTRAQAFKRLKDHSGLTDVFKADNFWGIAAILWLSTGLWRAFGGIEKGTDYYLNNTAFIVKMSLFTLIFFLEIRPMITLIKWRSQSKQQQQIDFSRSEEFAASSYIQLVLLAIMVLFAVTMSRGIWY